MTLLLSLLQRALDSEYHDTLGAPLRWVEIFVALLVGSAAAAWFALFILRALLKRGGFARRQLAMNPFAGGPRTVSFLDTHIDVAAAQARVSRAAPPSCPALHTHSILPR